MAGVLELAIRSPVAVAERVHCKYAGEPDVRGRWAPVRASTAQICMIEGGLLSGTAGAKMVVPSGLHAGWPTAPQPDTVRSRIDPAGSSTLTNPMSSRPIATAARVFKNGDHSMNQKPEAKGRLARTWRLVPSGSMATI